MMDRFAFIYSGRFEQFCYGREHPFKALRYRLAYELLGELGLLSGPEVQVVECPLASEESLRTFHRRDYLDVLREFSHGDAHRADFFYGLGDIENPVFPGMYEWSRLVCGGTLEAARLVVDEGCRVAFNMAGGWHHAHEARASGFSYLNDAVVAIHDLLRRGLRVAYVDIDAHHGDGVQEAFYATDRVLTVSLHETGDDFFPHTGYVEELGTGPGYGFAVNVPFLRHADDRLFRRAFRQIVTPVLEAFRPDVLVTQMGVDALRGDPLARLEFTTAAVEFAAREFLDTGLPWVALGGGGYDKVNVARAWALLWATVIGRPVPEVFPAGFAETLEGLGLASGRLSDPPHLAQADDFARAESALKGALGFLIQALTPVYGPVFGREN